LQLLQAKLDAMKAELREVKAQGATDSTMAAAYTVQASVLSGRGIVLLICHWLACVAAGAGTAASRGCTVAH
jgi:hypothetical protein